MRYTEDLDYFLNKPCTIVVRDINWHYKVENMMDYFMGIPYVIDENHIWTEHPSTGCKNCISLDQVVSINEEQFISENDPEAKEMIEEFKKRNPEMAEKTSVPPRPGKPPIQPQGFVNIEELMNMSARNGS